MFIVIRKSVVAECVAAYFLKRISFVKEIIEVDNITCPDDKLLEKIKGESVFIVGGYFTGNLEKFVQVSNQVTVFYNSKDTPDTCEHTIIKFKPCTGICTFVSQFLLKTHPHYNFLKKILLNFDEYIYGYSQEESLNFQNGFYELEGNNTQKINKLIDHPEIYNEIIELGKKRREKNLIIANERLISSKIYKFNGISIRVSEGESPIIDSCQLLATGNENIKGTGVGLLVRWNFDLNKTFVTCKTTKESGLNAGELMHQFIGGGGSESTGGGSICGIYTINQLFERFN